MKRHSMICTRFQTTLADSMEGITPLFVKILYSANGMIVMTQR